MLILGLGASAVGFFLGMAHGGLFGGYRLTAGRTDPVRSDASSLAGSGRGKVP